MTKGRLIILFFFCSLQAFGQPSTHQESFPYVISLNKQLGFIADVSNANDHLINSHVYPLHLDLAYKTRGSKPWHRLYNYPEHGISFWHINFKNEARLGHMFVAMPYINFRIFEKGRFGAYLRPSIGMAWVTKTFHRTDNHKNLFYSSHLNAAFGFMGEFSYKLNPNLSFRINPLFNHFSNGETSMPNDGMNVPGISVGIKYVSNPDPEKRKPVLHVPEQRKLTFSVSPTFAFKEAKPYEGPRYYVYTLTSDILYKISRWQYVGGGFDFIYDEENVRKWLGKEAYQKGDIGNNLQALHLTHEMNVYPLHIVAQMGMYTNNKILEPKQKFFNRFGIKYFVHPKVFLGIMHKSHFFFIGDYIDWMVGVRL